MNPRLFSSYFTAGNLAPDLDIKPLQAHTYFDLIRETKRSLLQACSSNAKFTFDLREGRSYTKITAPFREILGKEDTFKYTEERKDSYRELMSIASSGTTLRPFNASPKGLTASI